MRTYYDVLGVSEKAELREVKSAFKRLAVRYHPDKNPDDPQAEDRFKEVNEAYQVLSDPTRRFMYDQRVYSVRQMGNQAYPSSGRTAGGARSRGSYMSQSRDRRTRWREARDHYRPHAFTGQATQNSSARASFNSKKDQSRGILGAISFVGFMALMVSLGISLYTMAKRMEESAVRKEQQQFINKLKENHDADSIRSTLAIIDRRIAEEDGLNTLLFDFRNSVVRIMKDDAIRLYREQKYDKALEYLKVWKEQFPQDQKWLDPQIVDCQLAMDRIDQAEKLLKEIQSRNQNHLFVYMTLGKIYRDHQDSPEDALFYYNKASQQIIKEYKEEYGEAYAIMMDPQQTPLSQYEVFMAKASLSMKLGKYDLAKSASKWASVLRPHKIEPWLQQGRAYQKMGNQKKACESWRRATEFGHVVLLDSLIKYCQAR